MKPTTKYVAFDVHQATTVASVRNDSGRVLARSVLETHGPSIVEFLRGMRGAVHVAFEVGDPVAEHLEMIEQLSHHIRVADRHIETLATQAYPETEYLRQVAGVGPITSLCYVLTLEDPSRLAGSRAVGAYLGLRPKQRDSGARSPQLSISKRGDVMLRRLLVGSAQYILGPFGPDCDLRRWGLRIAERGGGNAKKRAVVAVARKLSCLLHRLWINGAVYEPIRSEATAMAS